MPKELREKSRGYKWNKLWKIVLSNEVNSKQTEDKLFTLIRFVYLGI